MEPYNAPFLYTTPAVPPNKDGQKRISIKKFHELEHLVKGYKCELERLTTKLRNAERENEQLKRRLGIE